MGKKFGVGINDADYAVTSYDNAGKRQHCPYYRKWSSMLNRCYGDVGKTYTKSYVCTEWLTFSNFKKWMETQNWVGMELDKDLLHLNNNEYSPSTCIFVPKAINSLFVDSKSSRGNNPMGVSYDKKRLKYEAYISIDNKKKHLGYFDSPTEAHTKWQYAKLNVLGDFMKTLHDPIHIQIVDLRIHKLKNDIQNNSITESLHHF